MINNWIVILIPKNKYTDMTLTQKLNINIFNMPINLRYSNIVILFLFAELSICSFLGVQ